MRISARLVAAVGASAAAILMNIIPQHEGTVLHAYRDPVGVWTGCSGVTKGIVPGAQYTPEQCEAMDAAAIADHAEPVMACVPQIYGLPNATAAIVDVAYNVGVRGFCRSNTAQACRERRMAECCAGLETFRKPPLPGRLARLHEMRLLCEMDLP